MVEREQHAARAGCSRLRPYDDVCLNVRTLYCTAQLGYLGKAQEVLSRAIEIENTLVDAFWHRHLVYVLQRNYPKALEDLNIVQKFSVIHHGVHKAKCALASSLPTYLLSFSPKILIFFICMFINISDCVFRITPLLELVL